MDLKELLDYCKAEAISNTLLHNEVSIWREICRNYSQKFATPLHQCLDGTIPPEDIVLAHFEEQLSEYQEEKDLEALLDQIYMLADPDYEREKRKELDDFIKKAEKEDEERIRLGKPIHKAMKEEVSLKNTSEETLPEKPAKTGGSINLSYLASEEEKQRGQF